MVDAAVKPLVVELQTAGEPKRTAACVGTLQLIKGVSFPEFVDELIQRKGVKLSDEARRLLLVYRQLQEVGF